MSCSLRPLNVAPNVDMKGKKKSPGNKFKNALEEVKYASTRERN